ncbi:MAG: nitrogenase, partial [Desulfobulbaceae bacterium]|nr:nitrogenase [Desulfobulbaceae bacterium]
MKTMTYKKKYVSTTNACKLCRPLGAMLAFRGIEGAVPFLHGSQGCATYMRRYIISHFNEPIDIASSSLGEKNAVYGGGANIKQGLVNVINKFHPTMVGIATTCLTETIGDDVEMFLSQFRRETEGQPLPHLIHTSTPSYSGTHMEGFHGAVRATVDALAEPEATGATLNLLPGFISPADTRYLQEIMADFNIAATILPDISETLDAPALRKYEMIPEGGTPISAIRGMGGARASIEFGRTIIDTLSPGQLLEERFNIPCSRLGVPMGLRETDRFFAELEQLTGIPTPEKHAKERGRLIDGCVD